MNEVVRLSPGELMEQVIIKGDLSKLSPDEKSHYYTAVCQSVGLNPLTKPLEYITLNGKLTLYARKDCTDQLRTIHNISVEELSESERDGVFIVTCKVRNAAGRTDVSKGAVNISGLKGEALGNAIMKAETKSKRRATLSICGLGILDELEIETIPREHVRRDEPVRQAVVIPLPETNIIQPPAKKTKAEEPTPVEEPVNFDNDTGEIFEPDFDEHPLNVDGPFNPKEFAEGFKFILDKCKTKKDVNDYIAAMTPKLQEVASLDKAIAAELRGKCKAVLGKFSQ